MEGIEFNNDTLPQHVVIEEKQPKLIRILMKLGVSDPIKANYILLCIAFSFIVASVFLFVGPGSAKTDLKPIIIDQQRVIREMQSRR